MTPIDPARLHAHIRVIPDFPSPGILFRDITPLLADANAFHDAIELLAHSVPAGSVDLIAAVEARGFLFAGALAIRLGCGMVPVRKPGKLPGAAHAVDYALEYRTDRLEIHRDACPAGARVLVVDDLIATGGTALACGELIAMCGARIAGFRFLIDLPALGGSRRLNERGWSTQAVLSF